MENRRSLQNCLTTLVRHKSVRASGASTGGQIANGLSIDVGFVICIREKDAFVEWIRHLQTVQSSFEILHDETRIRRALQLFQKPAWIWHVDEFVDVRRSLIK